MQTPLWQHLACLGSQLGYCWEFRHRMKGWRYSAAVCSHHAGMPSHSRDLQTASICIKSLCCHQLGVMSYGRFQSAIIIINYDFFNIGVLLKAQPKKPIHYFDESLRQTKMSQISSSVTKNLKSMSIILSKITREVFSGSWQIHYEIAIHDLWIHIPGLMLIKTAAQSITCLIPSAPQ